MVGLFWSVSVRPSGRSVCVMDEVVDSVSRSSRRWRRSCVRAKPTCPGRRCGRIVYVYGRWGGRGHTRRGDAPSTAWWETVFHRRSSALPFYVLPLGHRPPAAFPVSSRLEEEKPPPVQTLWPNSDPVQINGITTGERLSPSERERTTGDHSPVPLVPVPLVPVHLVQSSPQGLVVRVV